MIKQIGMENVKGQTAVQQLTGKDIIIGRNGAGKTTRMQTIGLAMLGYVPGKGKTAADTFKLASDDQMTVSMETDNFAFERTFTKTKKLKEDGTTDSKISQKITVSPSMGETTNTQKEQRIKQEMGDLPVMLDFGSFIAMTDNQQRDFIYNLSGNGFTWNRSRVEEELTRVLLTPEMEENNPDLYDCMQESIRKTMNQYREGIDVQAGILAMSEFAKDQLKYWKKEKINADGAAKKLTELKNRGDQTDRDLVANQEKLKELQDKREQIIKELAELTAKNNVLTEKEDALKKLQDEIAALEENQDATEQINSIQATIESLIAEIEEKENNHKEFDLLETDLQNTLAGLQEALKTENEKLLGVKEMLATINAEIKANGDLLQRISESHGCCAFSPNIPCNQDFSTFIEETNNRMDAAYDQKDDQEHLKESIEKLIQELQEKVRDTQTKQRENQTNKRNNERDIAQKKKELEQKKTELLELQSREPVIAAKRQQEAEIAAYLEENQKVDLTAMEDQKTLISGQIQTLTATIDEQKKVRNDLANIKANIIDSQTAEFNVLCWNQINNAIGQKGIKGSMMKEMLDPLLEDIDQKLHEIGIQEKFYFETNSDTGKEIFEFGWGTKPFEALSTGEQLLLMTALMTTMIERANPPVKVLAIDNINDLDSYNLSRVIKGLNTVGTKMDNIILAGVAEPTEEDSEGWTVWRL